MKLNAILKLKDSKGKNVKGTKVITSHGISKSQSLEKLTLNNVYNLGDVTNNENPNTSYSIGWLDANSYNITNTYYKKTETMTGSNISNEGGTGMSLEEMKSGTLLNYLNNNIRNINLTQIDSNLKGYTLVKWKTGRDGYPVFEYQK